MSKETSTILRSMLITVRTAKCVEDIDTVITSMCDGDDIAHVEAALKKRAEKDAKQS